MANNMALAVNGFPTLAEVGHSPHEFLGKFDVGLLNAICAGGLPGAENQELAKLRDWLDVAAEAVSHETRRHWYRFLDSPGTYFNSPGYFCCYFMLQVLQEEFGVKYNPARIRDSSFQDPKCFDPDFKDSRDLFIHGIIDGPGGTCASMPVLYVAVGRPRLGYPLRLVEARGHLFFRWDDPTGERFGIPERFNIEGAGQGIGSYPDDYYQTWPDEWTEQDKAGGFYLKSLSPTEELAAFLCTRGECLTDNGRLAEAIQAYEWAVGLVPEDPRYRTQLMKLRRRSQQQFFEFQEMLEVQREARQRRLDGPQGPHRLEPTLAPHGDYCQCAHCRKTREPKGSPGHPTGCPCFHCRQAQALNQRQGAPGHPPGCGCFHCQRSKPNPFSPW